MRVRTLQRLQKPFHFSTALKMCKIERGCTRLCACVCGSNACEFALTAAAAARVRIDLIETLFICSKEIEIFDVRVCEIFFVFGCFGFVDLVDVFAFYITCPFALLQHCLHICI